jgi:hypothetical protein
MPVIPGARSESDTDIWHRVPVTVELGKSESRYAVRRIAAAAAAAGPPRRRPAAARPG